MPRNPAPTKQKKKPEPVEDTTAPTVQVIEPPTQPSPPVKVIERRIETIVIEIPLGEPPHRFDQVHVEGMLWRDHAHTFVRLRQALQDQDSRTADGRKVKTNPDVLRWLMEQFASC
jgi:hypothetical protein